MQMNTYGGVKRACPVCGAASVAPLYANSLAPLGGLDMSYELARCTVCGFHFAHALPDEAQYLRYYRELSKYDSQPSVSAIDRERNAAAVDFCLQHKLAKNLRILDLGCGFGALHAALRAAGFGSLQGLDPAPHSGRQARALFGLDGIAQGTLAQAHEVLNLHEVDLVCLMAVLEHLPCLRRDLGRLLQQLRPGALLLLEVPALEFFAAHEGEPFGELSIEHIQFFSAASLRNLLSSLGAVVLGQTLLPLAGLHLGSLFVLAQTAPGVPGSIQAESPAQMDAYLAGSAQRWNVALQRVPDQPFVLYGAGSHSARLLPRLDEAQRRSLVTILDANANLHGKRLGAWTVEPPEALSKYPGLPVLISSYRSELQIARSLRQRHPAQPLVPMYHHV